MEIFLIPNFQNIAFYAMTLLWLLEVFLVRIKQQSIDYEERQSFVILALTIIISIIATIILTRYDLFVFPTSIRQSIRLIGLASYFLGLTLRYVSRFYLGRYFSTHVRIQTDHQLIIIGPYRIFRHPLYVGLLLLVIGVPLYIGNWLIFIFAFVTLSMLLNWRMIHEERMLQLKFGAKYTDYLKKSYRFIPFVY
ncbi:MAG TPA: isoprenylcysteine carboxylmethyltransferase family protein [Bacilli bacterium]|nr:isoprenylcysteine carboxylmethyltransferase family protein [Bacilli bacterium]